MLYCSCCFFSQTYHQKFTCSYLQCNPFILARFGFDFGFAIGFTIGYLLFSIWQPKNIERTSMVLLCTVYCALEINRANCCDIVMWNCDAQTILCPFELASKLRLGILSSWYADFSPLSLFVRLFGYFIQLNHLKYNVMSM